MLNPNRLSTYRRRLSNPGRRSTIPDAYLKELAPNLFAKRQHNRQVTADNRNPLYNPTAVLSGHALKALAQKLAGLELNPQISATKQELGLAQANDKALVDRVSGYNKGVNDYMAGIVRETGTSAGNLASALARNTSSTLSALATDNAGDQQLSAADTALRGQGLGGGMDQRLAGDYARQVAGTQARMGAQDNQGLVQSTGWAGLAGVMAGAAAMRGADNVAQAATYGVNREAGITTKLKGIEGSRGALEAKDLVDLRKSEFEKAAAVQTLSIKGTQAQASLINAQKTPESTYSKEVAKWSAKLGLTPHAFNQLSPAQRQARIKVYNNAGKSGPNTPEQINRESMAREAAKYGRTYEQWLNLSIQQRNHIAKTYGKTPSNPKAKSHWLTPTQVNSSLTRALGVKNSIDVTKLKDVGYKELRDNIWSKHPNLAPGLVNAITDSYILGYMTTGTARMLRVEKIPPKRVASALGLRIGKAPGSPLNAYPTG